MTDGPYKLPDGWRWVRLGEVARRIAELVQPSAQPDTIYNHLGMDQVPPGQWDEPSPNPVPGAQVASACVMFRPGFVLYGKLRPYLNKVVLCSRQGIASSEFVPLEADRKDLEPAWLAAYLRTPRFVAYAASNTTGSRQPRVRLDALWESRLRLPPIHEQRRILTRIEELMGRIREARRLREEAKGDADRLMQAALAEVFPRPGSPLPLGWRWVRLGEVATYERRSLDPRRHPTKSFLLYSIPGYDNGEAPEEVVGAEIGSAKLLVRPGVCLFSKLNPRLPRAWVLKDAFERHQQLSSTEFMPLRPQAGELDLDYLGKVVVSERSFTRYAET